VVELKQKQAKSMKHAPEDDCTNDNNVWSPKVENQIRKSGRQHESEKSSAKKKKQRNDEVFPSDVIIQKARDVGKMKSDVNEKSQMAATLPRRTKVDEKLREKVEEQASSQEELLNVLSKITQHQKKICQYLDYLREIIEDPPEVEDMEDLKKRQKRALEFSNRFARNHLYQIGRNVS
jgi:hypothetical protein